MTGLLDTGMLRSHRHHTAVNSDCFSFCQGVWVDRAWAFWESGAKGDTTATANATAAAQRTGR